MANVLLVEDDIVDVIHLKKGFEEYNIHDKLTIAKNGAEALDKLYGRNNIPKMPKPTVIILDVSMPRMSGIELLKILRSDAEFSHLPVFMLSSSNSDRDLKAANALNVLGYFFKPLDFEAFLPAYNNVVEHLETN